MNNSKYLYYLCTVEDSTNVVPSIGAFTAMPEINKYISDNCLIYGTQIVEPASGQVLYIRKERVNVCTCVTK